MEEAVSVRHCEWAIEHASVMAHQLQPVLHFGETRLQKHRIDKPRLVQFLEEWKARKAMEGDNSSL